MYELIHDTDMCRIWVDQETSEITVDFIQYRYDFDDMILQKIFFNMMMYGIKDVYIFTFDHFGGIEKSIARYSNEDGQLVETYCEFASNKSKKRDKFINAFNKYAKGVITNGFEVVE